MNTVLQTPIRSLHSNNPKAAQADFIWPTKRIRRSWLNEMRQSLASIRRSRASLVVLVILQYALKLIVMMVVGVVI